MGVSVTCDFTRSKGVNLLQSKLTLIQTYSNLMHERLQLNTTLLSLSISPPHPNPHVQAAREVDAAADTTSASTTSPSKFLTKLRRFEEAGCEAAEEEDEEEEVCVGSFNNEDQ